MSTSAINGSSTNEYYDPSFIRNYNFKLNLRKHYLSNRKGNNICLFCLIMLIICSIATNLMLYTYFLSHILARLRLTRFLTSISLSVCALIITNFENLVILLNVLLDDDVFYCKFCFFVYNCYCLFIELVLI